MKLIIFSLGLSLFFGLLGCSSTVKQEQVAVIDEPREVASEIFYDKDKDPAKLQNGKDVIEPVMWEFKKKDNSGVEIEGDKAFEKRLKVSKQWTAKLYELIPKETVLQSVVPTDVDFFCSNYKNLGPNQRANFWVQLIAAISYKESEWSPVCSFPEPPYGRSKKTGKKLYNIDGVTKDRVRSEGLMQLSYQDRSSYMELKNPKDRFDCEFDWKKDLNLERNDPQRSILAPLRNLRCGLRILNHKVKTNNQISTKGTYWSVLRPRNSNSNSKTHWIAKQTQSLSFCAVKPKAQPSGRK